VFKTFLGLVSLVGLAGAGTLGACSSEVAGTNANANDSGNTADAGKKETGPVGDADPGMPCYGEPNPFAVPPAQIIVANQPGKCTDAQLAEFGKVCGNIGGDKAECDKYLAAPSTDPAKKACGTCLTGSADPATNKVTLGAFTSANAGYLACVADKLGVKDTCSAPLAAESICTESACDGCNSSADGTVCNGAALDGPCASVIVTDASECGKAMNAAAADATKTAAAKTACGGDATDFVGYVAKLGAYYCK
jgi:hypothetical protein